MTTLATLRTRARDTLADASTTFTDAQIDEAARYALDRISTVAPYRRVQTLTFASSSRELSIAALTQPATLYAVWCPYDASNDDPPMPAFEVLPGNLLRILDGSCPSVNDVARIFYTTPHTLNGLDGAGTTTLDADGMTALTIGAAAHVVNARLRNISEAVRADPGSSYKTLPALRDALLKDFTDALAALRKKNASRAGGYIHWH